MLRNEFLRIMALMTGSSGNAAVHTSFSSEDPGCSSLEESDMATIKSLLSSKSGKNWVFTGDSITQGAKHTYGFKSFPEIFSERIRWEMNRSADFVINTAMNGNSSSDVVGDFDRRVIQFHPAVVSVMLGVNDCANPLIPQALFESNLNWIVAEIRRIGAVPLLHTPNRIRENHTVEYASREKLGAYTEIVRKVASHNQTILIDNWGYWAGKPYLGWLDDSLHPNHLGHIEIARQLFISLSIFDENSFSCSGRK